MNKKNVVLFSLYDHNTIVSEQIIDFWFNNLKNYFIDDKIIIGINSESILPKIEDKISSLNMDISFGYVNKEQKIDSDAAGYLKCIEMLNEIDYDFDTIFFMHSKGVSHKSFNETESYRNMILNDFFINKNKCIELLNDYGIVGNEPSIFGVPEHINNTFKIKNILNLQYNPIGFFYCGTFYAIKYDLIKNILSHEFFNKNIWVHPYNMDRFFFEGVFKSIPEMMGKTPYILNERRYKNSHQVIQSKVFDKINEWEKNKIDYIPKVWY